MPITVLLVYVSIASDVLPLLAALSNYKQLEKTLKLFALFCLVSFGFDLLEWILSHFRIPNNYPLFHLYDLFAILFFTAIYYLAFFKPIFKKMALLLGGIALSAVYR